VVVVAGADVVVVDAVVEAAPPTWTAPCMLVWMAQK
jgi:hypothetical protein